MVIRMQSPSARGGRPSVRGGGGEALPTPSSHFRELLQATGFAGFTLSSIFLGAKVVSCKLTGS